MVMSEYFNQGSFDMSRQANKWLQVRDWNRSLAFCRDVLGFRMEHADSDKKVAVLLSPWEEPVVISEPDSEEAARFLAPVYERPDPGKTVYFLAGDDLASYRDRIGSVKGADAFRWKETEWGWTSLTVRDPDGYLLSFERARTLTDEEILHFYEEGIHRLRRALDGLGEKELDLAREPGKWSIRQLVLHLVDSDATALTSVKFALAESGRTIRLNPYDPDVWAEGLGYAFRPIDAEVLLFEGIRRHILGLLHHLPDAMSRSVRTEESQVIQVRDRVSLLARHALHHIEQILETRKVHGV
jgi:catechol 2,3-dioxygenase-like lactoylglutathione lyase family enzyme